jgi:hypothetical protein
MQEGSQPVAGVAGWVGGDFFGSAGGDDLAAAGAAFEAGGSKLNKKSAHC